MASDDAPKQKALDLAIKQIEKQYGKGSIMRMGDAPVVGVAVIPTGSLALDAALGVGGVPRGRVVEIFGPESSGKTTLAIHCIAEAQKLGGTCAFIDAEHAFDASYARNLGVDIDGLLMSQPDTGEQALSICETLVRSGALDLIVVDSVAALVPRAEIEGDMGDSHVGLQARLMSQALRKLTGVISRSKTALIFINQLREKIGVMWGCFQYNTRVVLADGTTKKIGKIVNQRLPVEVLSYDPQTGALEPRRVVNWFDNGTADYFLQFEVEGGPSGRRHFAATPNHTIFTPSGEVAAGDLREGDEVLTMVADYRLTEDQWQLLLGSALGDGSLRKISTHATMFRVRHSQAQEDYVEWKHWMLEPFSRELGPAGNGIGFDTLSFPALTDVREELYAGEGHRTATAAVLDRLDARGIAVWYGDDGSFAGSYERWGRGKAVLYNASLKGKDRERVAALFERLDVGRPVDFERGFRFDAEQTARLHALIAPYLHPAVEYKLHPELRGRFTWQPDLRDAHLNGTRLSARRCLRAVPARIKKIYVKPPTRSMRRFDLEVEGNHTYLVDGVVVHNSPETTPGGRALKFYCSVRLDIRRIGSVKDGSDVIGNRTRVKVVKNKVAPPFQQAEFDIIYGKGVSSLGELTDLAVEHDIISKSGSWYSYGEIKIGQGREAAKTWLQDNPEEHDEVKSRVKVALGMKGPLSDEDSPVAIAEEARNGIVSEEA